MRAGTLQRGDLHVTTADGRSIAIEYRAKANFIPGRHLAILRDITDRVRAQEAVGRLEARNSAVLRAIPDLMFVLLRDGTYVDYHAKDPTLLFERPDGFIGKKIRDVMPSTLAGTFMDAIERACQGNEVVVVEYELALGETRYFEARLVQAGPDRVLSMVRDVTDAKRALAMNQHLAGRLIASQERERQRIARDLHDDLSQKIALLNIEVDQAALQASSPPLRAQLTSVSARIGEIATDVHNLSHELHPSKLQTLGLVAAIHTMCRDISRQGSVQVTFVHGVVPQPIDWDISLCLYRIVQEALHNVSSHSRAPSAEVQLTREQDTLTLRITDSGVGFEAQRQHAGLGLVSMRERVALLRGQMVIQSARGIGTRLEVRVPMVPAQQAIDLTYGAIAHTATDVRSGFHQPLPDGSQQPL